ncbi:hypothetical protein OCU04_006506 [Sclerotinia nivalis]|uniref:Uncharacterized protein n=1 Tax=Sclerotinia nivalis TaxID=352851 RepID=A0A9X0ANC3_9HELO|nr:hypothetical protein OCU04_006506 [Sclerotinia nivalis]
MTTPTEEDLVSPENKSVPVVTDQKQDIERVQPVADLTDEASQRLEKLKEEYGLVNIGVHLLIMTNFRA